MATQIGTDALCWGCTDHAWGYFTNFAIEESVTATEAKNGAGETVDVEFHGKHWVVTGTYTYRTRTDGDSPDYEVGTGAAIDLYAGSTNETWLHNSASTVLATVYIKRVKATRAVDAFMEMDFEGEYYGNLA